MKTLKFPPKSLCLHFLFRKLLCLNLAEDSDDREIEPENNLVLRMLAQFRAGKNSILKKGGREFTPEMMKSISGASTLKLSECYLGRFDHTTTNLSPHCSRQDWRTPLLNSWPTPEKSPSVTAICFLKKIVLSAQSFCGFSSIDSCVSRLFLWW